MKRPLVSVDPSDKKKGKKLQFSPKVVDIRKKPLQRNDTWNKHLRNHLKL